MTDYRFELLDLSSPAAVQEYETAFYRSFSDRPTNRPARKLWLWDQAAQRLKTRVPYEAQLICALREPSGALHSAMAFNVALRHFQSAAYGFPAPQQRAGTFEVLTFFAVVAESLEVRAHFWSRCVTLLSACGFNTGYATTGPRPLPMYRRAGWQVLDECEIELEKRYFLQYRVPHLEPQRETWRGLHALLTHERDCSDDTAGVPCQL